MSKDMSTVDHSLEIDGNDNHSVFQGLDADDDVNRLAELESLCMECHENGTTRMLLTKIPYFRDIIVMSFECPHCHWRNNEIQPANAMDEKGVEFTLKITAPDTEQGEQQEEAKSGGNTKSVIRVDLDRQIIKSETATLYVPEFDFEVPANKQRGEINTVEGIVAKFADALDASYLQNPAITLEEETRAKMEVLVANFKLCALGQKSFTLVLRDPTGNSFVENPHAPLSDPRCSVKYFERTLEQNQELGYAVPDEPAPEKKDNDVTIQVDYERMQKTMGTYFDVDSRAVIIPGSCSECGQPAETRMALTEIPYFKEIIIMVSDCIHCGYKNSEIKPGGAVSEHGTKITLQVNSAEDLKRDVLKSDTAGVLIPELELEMVHGTLGGKYTTLEGLLTDIKSQLTTSNPFALGDSSAQSQFGHASKPVDANTPIVAFTQEGLQDPADVKENPMTVFIRKLDACIAGDSKFTFILDDPMSNCFVHNPYAPEEDKQVTVTTYTRTFEMNEELGLNDMKTENYITTIEEEPAAEEDEDPLAQPLDVAAILAAAHNKALEIDSD